MSVTRPAYCTREDVLRATDATPSLRVRTEVDGAICSAAQAVDGALNRVFYPTTATRYFRWPNTQRWPSWRLWLEADELISYTAMTSGGVTISTANAYLEPNGQGPPFDRLELNVGTTASFTGGSTPQRDIAITGVYGYRADTAPAGTLAVAVNSSITTVQVSDSSAVGVGDLLICGSEYMLVTEASMVTTAQTLQTPLTADTAVVAVAVTTGTDYTAGEVIQLDTEQMEIQSVTGNTLTVDRAVRGTVLATHTGSTIYAPRSLTVQRGSVGTTAASHLISVALTKHVPPPLITEWALAEALTMVAGRSGGWARPAGSGAGTRPDPGAGLPYLRAQAMANFYRVPGPGVV